MLHRTYTLCKTHPTTLPTPVNHLIGKGLWNSTHIMWESRKVCRVGKKQASCPSSMVTRDASLFNVFQRYTISLTHLLPCHHQHHRDFFLFFVIKRLLQYSWKLSISRWRASCHFLTTKPTHEEPSSSLPPLLPSYCQQHSKKQQKRMRICILSESSLSNWTTSCLWNNHFIS